MSISRKFGGGGGGGGGWILPTATLDITNFLSITTNATTDLMTFFLKIIWQQFDLTCHYPRNLTLPYVAFYDVFIRFHNF